MYIRKRKWVFFLLFAGLISFPLVLAFGLGQRADRTDLRLYLQSETVVSPLLVTTNNSVKLYIPANEQDYWRIRDNRLELLLYAPEARPRFSPGRNWLDQQVESRHEDGFILVSIEANNLSPVFRVLRRPEGYIIEWSKAGIEGKRIAIDPGHGGHDPGAISLHSGLLEKDVTLNIALELQRLLEEAGAEVFMTRSTDTLVDTTVQIGQKASKDFWKRFYLVDEWSPDFFISIHINSWEDRYAGGIETYYNKESFSRPHSQLAARLVQKRLVEEIQRRDRGVKAKKVNDAVLNGNDYPAVLAEVLYMSNKVEARLIAEPGFAPRVAKAIFLAIDDYFNSFGGENR